MNDRFKSRFFHKPTGKYLTHASYIYCDGRYHLVSTDIDSNPYILISLNESEIIEEQCTGLKDKNGKLIYEGDIIRKENQRFIIKYDFDSFKAYDKEKRPISIYGLFTFKICSGGWPEKETENTIEVIGNIHENSELLEKE